MFGRSGRRELYIKEMVLDVVDGLYYIIQVSFVCHGFNDRVADTASLDFSCGITAESP